MNQRQKNRIAWMLAAFTVTIGCALVWANRVVENATTALVYSEMKELPFNRTGLLLGTAKTLSSGKPNPYFQYRIDAAVALFNSSKIENIVISGDNSSHEYDEPEDMKAALMARGISEYNIYLDYAGFRTLDSVMRMEKIFGQTSFTVISQEFHNRRAIYTAQAKGLKAVGFNAQDVAISTGWVVQLREKFARVKLFLDLWTNRNPKFLGEKIYID